jgi:hypothetical protein
MIKIGDLNISKLCVGDSEVSKVYLGDTEVYSSGPAPEPAYSAMPLTFDIISAGTIVWYTQQNPKVIEYKINDGSWTSITSSTETSISVQDGDKVQFRGYNDTYGVPSNDPSCSTFIGSGNTQSTAIFNIYGNVMSLIDGDNYQGLQFTNDNIGAFVGLFNCFGATTNNKSLISAENLILPDNVVENCYRGMFMRSKGLTTPPVLPATTLANSCYNRMFAICYELTTAPVLPATALTTECYRQMFNDCRKIERAPELPAATLADSCYYQMFTGCTSLDYIKCLATDISASNCTYQWVKGVRNVSTCTFVKKTGSTWSSGDSGILSNWIIEEE